MIHVKLVYLKWPFQRSSFWEHFILFSEIILNSCFFSKSFWNDTHFEMTLQNKKLIDCILCLFSSNCADLSFTFCPLESGISLEFHWTYWPGARDWTTTADGNIDGAFCLHVKQANWYCSWDSGLLLLLLLRQLLLITIIIIMQVVYHQQ